MGDVISLLPDSIANQIAAGEVIQRPASVVKELVENAVDAGATKISVLVADAGRTSIQVIDNGRGMSPADARLCFERHATSKISQAADLFSLSTMGFRGEALASIAAVAQVELVTRTEGEDVGTRVQVSASRITGQEPVACPVGSNFTVSNIFYNVPARRKFLKSNATEVSNILQAFERIALVYPGISFSYYSNGVETLNLRACKLRQRILDVLGKKANQDLLPVGVRTSVCRVSGFVGKPESARKKCSSQYFFVNGRYMRHPYFHKAVMMAFDRLIPAGDNVPYLIYLEVDPGDIDVNIHPTKTEIKFSNEQVVWQILNATVKDSIGRFHGVETLDFDTVGKPDIPMYDPARRDVRMPGTGIDPDYNPFRDNSVSKMPPRKPGNDSAWESLYRGLESATGNAGTDGGEAVLFPGAGIEEPARGAQALEDKSPVHYQYKGTYIMTSIKSGLMVIDQHRAHVRILYEQYLAQVRDRNGTVQRLLFPDIVRLSPSEEATMERIIPELEGLGFDLSPLGGGSFSVNGVPANLEGVNIEKLLKTMVVEAAELSGVAADAVRSSLALEMARSAAIPYGQVLSNEEMEDIINRLFLCSNVNYAPNGQPIMGVLRHGDIAGMFR